MNKPTIIVAGLTRCGSSLTMQMLHAAGLRCAGQFPAFEDNRCNNQFGPIDAAYVESFEAVKMLDVHYGDVPKLNAKVIWLDRNEVQQTQSIIKFMQFTRQLQLPSTAGQTILNSLRHDAPIAKARFDGLPLLTVKFEDLIERSLETAYTMADFINTDYSGYVSACKMFTAVQDRGSRGANCMPDMSMELRLIEKGHSK